MTVNSVSSRLDEMNGRTLPSMIQIPDRKANPSVTHVAQELQLPRTLSGKATIAIATIETHRRDTMAAVHLRL